MLSDEDVAEYLSDMSRYRHGVTNRMMIDQSIRTFIVKRRFTRKLRASSATVFDPKFTEINYVVLESTLEAKARSVLKFRYLRSEFSIFTTQYVFNNGYIECSYSLDKGIDFYIYSQDELRGTFKDYLAQSMASIMAMEEYLRSTIISGHPPLPFTYNDSQKNKIALRKYVTHYYLRFLKALI
jgi:hypothetical protein